MIGIHRILIDDSLYQKAEQEAKKKEIFIFFCLSAMIVVLSIIAAVSTFVYISIVFKSVLIAISTAIFMFLVIFNLIRLMFITSITAYHTKIGVFQLDHSIAFEDIRFGVDEEKDEIKIHEAVNKKKEALRNLSRTKGSYSPDFAQRISFLFKIFFLSFLAIIFATGIELLIFSPQLNQAFISIRELFANKPDSWILTQAIPAADNYLILDTNSILLAIDMLYAGLGITKFLIDLVFVLLFVIPLVIIYRSKKIYDSNYVRELVLSEVSISYYHYLITERACDKISEKIMKYDLNYMSDRAESTNVSILK